MAQDNTPAFQPIDLRGMRRLLKFAMIGMGQELRKCQVNLALDKAFGDEAIDYPESYNPNRRKRSEGGHDRQAHYDDLLAFSKNVQTMLDHVEDMDIKQFAEAFVSHIKSKQKK